MSLLYHARMERPAIVAGETLGYVMQHRSGPDRGFSWDAADAKFSDEWTRIPVGLVTPAPQRMAPATLAKLIADTAETQGIELDAVEAFSAFLTAVARGAEDAVLAQANPRDATNPGHAPADIAATSSVDGPVFRELLAELLDAAESAAARNDRFIYKAARERFVYHLEVSARLRAHHPESAGTQVSDPVAAALERAGLSSHEAIAFAAVARQRSLSSQRPEHAEAALDELQDRLERVYAASCGATPREALGELLDAMMQMPEWTAVRAALALEVA
jgi:hypothetical protein